MHKTLAAITGVHGYVPDYILTNEELATMVDTNDEWITTRTGIKERRILKDMSLATSDLGAEAVKGLLKKTNTNAEDIEVIICATVTADMHFPDTANLIGYKVGATNAFGFDLNAACCGFLFALNTAARFIESGVYKKVIVVGADIMSRIVDYTDRTTCVLFGDGAGAVLVEASPDGENGIIDSILKADGSGKDLLHMKAGGSAIPPSHETVDKKMHYIYQNGAPVFKAAVKGMTSTMGEILKKNNLTVADIAWVTPHQANKRIISSVTEIGEVPVEKVMINIHKYGNTTAATIPLCLWEYENQIKKGDKLLLTAFGGGFTWGTVYLKWAY